MTDRNANYWHVNEKPGDFGIAFCNVCGWAIPNGERHRIISEPGERGLHYRPETQKEGVQNEK